MPAGTWHVDEQPEVSYRLSPGGRALGPALAALDAWALAHSPPDKRDKTFPDGDPAAPVAGRNPVTAAEML